MLAGHLRGLILPKHQHGIRSLLFENIVMDAVVADSLRDDVALRVETMMAVAPLLKDDARRGAVRDAAKLVARYAELGIQQVYTFDKKEKNREINIVRLFEVLHKSGIMRPLTGAELADIEQARDLLRDQNAS